jgi:thioredoxin-related protein
MSHRGCTAVFVLLITGAALAGAQGIPWQSDLASATAEARRTGKIMMVDVYTDWCGWCKKLDTDTYADDGVIKGAARFVALKLNPEKGASARQFAEKYGVSGYPTILFVEADGTLANKVVGYVEAESFAAEMKKTTEYGPRVRAYLAEFASGAYRNSADLLSMLMELGRVDEAIPVFDRIRSGTSLPVPLREGIARDIARSLMDADDYLRALDYITVVEEINSGSDATRDAHLLHAIAIFYSRGKAPALDYLERMQADPKNPADWTERYQDLRDRMKAAKDPGGS